MATETAPTNVIDSGRFAWRGISMAAERTDNIADTVETLATQIAGLLSQLATAEAAAVSPTVRAHAARELAAATARLRHAALRLEVAAAGLIDQHDVHHLDAERTSRTWLARHSGLSHRQASELVRAATTCERFPLVGDAYRAGTLTLGHLDATANIIPARFRGQQLTDAITKVRAVQNVLIETATSTTVREYTNFCERVRASLDQDGPPDKSAEPSRIWLHQLFNGRWSLTGDLSADDGALIATILADIRTRRARETRHNRNTTSAPSDTDADDGGDVSPNVGATPDTDPDPADDDAPTYSELQAQDVLSLFVSGAGAGRPGRVGIYLHIDLDDLNAPTNGIDDVIAGRRTAHTAAGLDISDNTLWGLMAGAAITPIFNRNGTPLWYGRTRRLAPPELRRVLAHRDRRCRFPGCDRPPIACEVHHVDHWEDGGPTDPKTCAHECKYHHHAHHDRGYGISGDANSVLEFTRPDGTPLDVEPLYKQRRTA